MKLKELKVRVYELANVTTTKQLKNQYQALKTLDMRRKASWQTTLDQIQTSAPEKNSENTSGDLSSWLENPPEEYKKLFADIDKTSTRYKTKLKKAKHLSQMVTESANHLEALADEYQTEANHIKQDIETIQTTTQKARLN